MTTVYLKERPPAPALPVSLCANCIHVERFDCRAAGAVFDRCAVKTERGTIQVTTRCTQHEEAEADT